MAGKVGIPYIIVRATQFADPSAGYLGVHVDDRSLVPRDHARIRQPRTR